MDYEKMYKEALERAKRLTSDMTTLQKIREFIFPELRESEDERIRKFLFQHISEWIGCIEHDLKNSSKDIESEKELAMFKAGLAYLERQKENPKSADSIPSDCTADAKCEDRWHKVEDSLPDNPREVLCKDEAGNYFIGRYYVGEGWDISNYDDEDKPHHLNPPVLKWIDFPSEKQKEKNGKDGECTDFTIYHPQKNGKGKYECIPFSFYGSLTSFTNDRDLMDFLNESFYDKEECERWCEMENEPELPEGKHKIVDEIAQDYVDGVKEYNPEPTWDLIQTAVCYGANWQMKQFEKNRLANCDAVSKEECDRETDFAMEIIEKEHRQPTFNDAINYGMRLQKEQKPVPIPCGHENGKPAESDDEMIEKNLQEIENATWEIRHRLKSLRPSWKPSEEQMAALKNSAYGAHRNSDGPALRDLHEHLEKLR